VTQQEIFVQMNKRCLTSSLICIFSFFVFQLNTAFGQAPEGVNYQAIARDNSGNALTNQMISVRFGIIQGSANGNLLYEERYDMITTNDFGLFNLVIGEGAKTSNGSVSNFSQINWGAGPLFLKVEVDPGTGFENLGTSELVSVPYALYAKNSGSALSAGNGILIQNNTIINDGDLSINNELITNFLLNGSNLELSDAGGNRSVDLSRFNDSLQIVDSANAIRGDMPQLAQGVYNDTIATNELLTGAQLNGQVLEITDGGGTFFIDFSSFYDSTQVVDTANAIRQDLATLRTIALKDTSETNELISSAILNGQTIEITDAGGTFPINLGQFNDSVQIIDTANAIRQDLATLRTIALKDTSETNELISSATLNGQTIEITDAGGTYTINLSQFNDSTQIVDTAAAIRNAINLLQTYLLQEIADTAAALRTDLSTFTALDDTASAIRSELSAFGNVFSDGVNTTNRLTYWNSTDSVNAYNDVFIDPVNNRIGIGTITPQYQFQVNGRASVNWLQINGAYIMPTADGNTDQVLMTDGVGNLSWSNIDTAVCPTNMTNIGGRICIDSDERVATDWYSAASSCIAEGFKLPSWGEWYGAMDNATLNNETNNWEWVDGGTSNTARKAGNGDLRATANDDPRNSSAFRCILILK
jgi:hypothetical protein